MAQGTNSQTRIRAIDERLTRLRAERTRLAARFSHAERKRDTRRKILVGAAVLAAVEHEPVPSFRNGAELLNWLNPRLTRPHDRAAFDLPKRLTKQPTDV
jgi:large subunit ribosomal protein L7/L12